MQTVCKHNQTGYCKFGQKCHRHHIDTICKNEGSCSEPSCNFHHRNQCRYFNVGKKCKFTNCAYLHKKPGSDVKIELLETEVNSLKEKILELSNNMSEIMAKIVNIEVNDDNNERLQESVDNLHNVQLEPKQETANNHQYEFKCDFCDYKCSKGVTLMKHTNTLHPVSNTQIVKDRSKELKCVLCPDKFNTRNGLNCHLSEHLDEIREIEPSNLLNGHATFKCNLCEFQSTNNNSIKNHLVEHVNRSLPADQEENNDNEIENKEEAKPYNIMDKYGDDGRPLNESSSDDSDESDETDKL